MKPVNTDINISAEKWLRTLPNIESLATEVVQHGLSSDVTNLNVPAEVSLLFCDDDESQRLNKMYREKDYPTNVLSFAQYTGTRLATLETQSRRPISLGDIALSFGVVSKEAVEQNKRLSDHVTHLILHGLLHLLGFDHIDKVEAEKMEAIEIALLAELGVQNPYEDVSADSKERQVHG